jgi:hypothetical protein
MFRLPVAAGAAAAAFGFNQENAARADGYMVNVPLQIPVALFSPSTSLPGLSFPAQCVRLATFSRSKWQSSK